MFNDAIKCHAHYISFDSFVKGGSIRGTSINNCMYSLHLLDARNQKLNVMKHMLCHMGVVAVYIMIDHK